MITRGLIIFVITVALQAMIIICSRTQSFRWHAKCGRDRLQYSFRRSPKPVLDLREVRIRDASHLRHLAHGQLGELS